MTHLSSISSAMFTDLSIHRPATNLDNAGLAALNTYAEFAALFGDEIGVTEAAAAAKYVRVKNVRDFPEIGIPPNIVNVPVYGSKSSQQVSGQATSPSMEFNINYVPVDWLKTGRLGEIVDDGKQYVFRFTLLAAEPATYDSTTSGLGSVENTQWFFIGKLTSLVVRPSLSDASTARMAVTVQSAIFGPFTQDAV